MVGSGMASVPLLWCVGSRGESNPSHAPQNMVTHSSSERRIIATSLATARTRHSKVRCCDHHHAVCSQNPRVCRMVLKCQCQPHHSPALSGTVSESPAVISIQYRRPSTSLQLKPVTAADSVPSVSGWAGIRVCRSKHLRIHHQHV